MSVESSEDEGTLMVSEAQESKMEVEEKGEVVEHQRRTRLVVARQLDRCREVEIRVWEPLVHHQIL